MVLRRALKYLVWLVGIVLVAYVVLPKPLYGPAAWSHPLDSGIRKYQFSKYQVLPSYRMTAYRHSLRDRKKFVSFVNDEAGQYFMLFILRETPKVRHEDIIFKGKRIVKTLINRLYIMPINMDDNFDLEYLLPFFIREDLPEEPPKVEVRGFKMQGATTQLETEKTSVLVANGKFEKVGFYRLSDNPLFKYPMPIFAFRSPMQGAVAIINNKANGETIFAIGAVKHYQQFNSEEFLEIVKTVTFDKEPKAIFGSI